MSTNHKKNQFEITLVDTPYDGDLSYGDWAVWLITNPRYYSDSYFDMEIPVKEIKVVRAGWGWSRILSKKEL